MALELVVGALIEQVYDGVKQAMRRRGKLKTLLEDLKSTLESLQARDIQQIGEYNLELGLPDGEIESLRLQMEDGKKLADKLSVSCWRTHCCCLGDYGQQIGELDRDLKGLLTKLKMQETRDLKEVLVLLRQNRDKLDEVKGRLWDTHKLLQQTAGDAAQDLVFGCNTETVPDQAQGNGAEQATTFDLLATFSVLWDVVMNVKDKTTVFKSPIENLKSTLDSLRPLMEEIPEHYKLWDRRGEECKNFRMKMEKGVALVRKCSKVGLWTGCKSRKYRNEIIGLDEALQKLLRLLKVRVARDVRETSISIRNIEAAVKRIEESGVLLQNQTQTEGTSALPEPLSPTIGSDGENMQGASDARETLVPARNTKASVEKIEGIGAEQNPSEIKADSASSFGFSSSPAIPLTILGSVHFSLNQIAIATRNFSQSQQLGAGGYGCVFKGQLDDGQVVSIKQAKKEHFENLQTEFSSEVELLTKTDHRNLVMEEMPEHNKLLANGTLREHLDCGEHGEILRFNQRLDMAIDVAHDLSYLRLHAEKQIIHPDVKSHNILLTESMIAKVAHFGFARLGPMDSDRTHVPTQAIGTFGYLDPEYVNTGQLTPQSDVYSFGILLIQIMTGRRPVELKRPVEERVTCRWAFKKFNEGKVMELVDPSMKEVVEAELLVKVFDLAMQCAAPIGADRPDINSVRVQLQNIREDYLRSVK